MAWAPASSASKPARPMATATGSPITDHSEVRPPTPSSKAKQRPTPNSRAASGRAVSATKCAARSLPPWASNQARAEVALRSVSAVPKLLDATMNSVRSGFSPRSTAASSWPSMLATKCRRGASGSTCGASACSARRGPRSEPPMPMCTTSS